MKNFWKAAALLTATLSLAACGGGEAPAPTSDTTAPTVTLTAAPKPVTAAGAVSLTAAASDNVGVTKVTFFRGATEISTDTTAPYEATANVTAADNGTVTYSAIASDAAGNTKEATDSVSVSIGIAPPADTTAPTIALSAPATVIAAGAVNLSAIASDDVGVTQVVFYRGAAEISTDTSAPYTATDNVTSADNGPVVYRAVASDAAGNTKEATANTTVNIAGAPPADLTAPSVVSITPAAGATGVAKDANIVVTFSEKMNQAATQAAYQSTDLPAAAVTFSWNAAGTVMTINPNADLLYTAVGKSYAFTLTNTATDVAGNALPTKNSSFKTFRQLSATINSTPALDGWVRSDGSVDTASTLLYSGDSGTVSNATYRSYLSFDLGVLPAALTSANILSADLAVFQSSIDGNPYSDLDVGISDLILDHVNYGPSLTATDFDPTVYSNQGDIISVSNLGTYTKSVLGAFKDDRTNTRTRSQYRMRFAKLTDGDGNADIAYIKSGDSATNKPTLTVTYLIP